jgi:C_GCAxxG_C_C family probable redox protein
MSTPNNYADLIKSDYMLRNDFNCAETMLRGADEAFALQLPESALRTAAGFGGGMGRERACGALTGSLMALGALRSAGKSHQDPEFGALRDELVRRFEERFGSLDCSEIKQTHRTEARGCSAVVEMAAEILEEVLEAKSGPEEPGAAR